MTGGRAGTTRSGRRSRSWPPRSTPASWTSSPSTTAPGPWPHPRCSRRCSRRPASTAARCPPRRCRARHHRPRRGGGRPGRRADPAGVPGRAAARGVPRRGGRRVRGHRHRGHASSATRPAGSPRCRAAPRTSRSRSPTTWAWRSGWRSERLEQPQVVLAPDPAGRGGRLERRHRVAPGQPRHQGRRGRRPAGRRARRPRPAGARPATRPGAARPGRPCAPTYPSSTTLTVSVTGRTPTTTAPARRRRDARRR